MAIGFVDFTVGQVFGADDADGILRQTIMSFAGSSERDTDLSGALEEGMHAYLRDVNAVTWYNGSAWRTLWSQWTAFTPSWSNVTQGSGATNTGFYRYTPGNLEFSVNLILGTGGSLSGAPAMTLPNSETVSGSGNVQWAGSGRCHDETGSDYFVTARGTSGASTVVFITLNSSAQFVVVAAAVPFTWAVSDSLQGTFSVPVS